jgi:hypothetical protein
MAVHYTIKAEQGLPYSYTGRVCPLAEECTKKGLRNSSKEFFLPQTTSYYAGDVVEATDVWIIVIRGEAEGQDVRVALDFQNAETLLSPRNFIVGDAFINQLLELIQIRENWVIKTVIEEVRTPQEIKLSLNVPLFAILTKSYPRRLSAGALFISEEVALGHEVVSEQPVETTDSILGASKRFVLTGLSPVGFTAACADDSKLFTRFISRLLKRPEAFEEVSLLLPRSKEH